MDRLLHRDLTERILTCAVNVHRGLGPGLLESAYSTCLGHELSLQGLNARREVSIPVTYKGCELESGFRVDMIVEEKVLVELKAVERLLPIHDSQLLTYLKLTGLRVGLLFNFNVPVLRHGIRRMVF